MRDILFRGKRVDNGEWVEGYYAKVKNYLTEKEEHIIIPLDTTLYYETVDPETVGEYIGFDDRNSQKIFEGDIMAFHLEDEEERTIDGVIKYGNFNCSCCDGVYGWYIDGGDIRCIDYTNWGNLADEIVFVVGNIHDNPELLEEKKT